MRLNRIITGLVFLCFSTCALTSCGGGDSHNLNAVQLEELDAALVQLKAKESADDAALAKAVAAGASLQTIEQLRAKLVADEQGEFTLASAPQFSWIAAEGASDQEGPVSTPTSIKDWLAEFANP